MSQPVGSLDFVVLISTVSVSDLSDSSLKSVFCQLTSPSDNACARPEEGSRQLRVVEAESVRRYVQSALLLYIGPSQLLREG